jgi:hypothetical protein
MGVGMEIGIVMDRVVPIDTPIGIGEFVCRTIVSLKRDEKTASGKQHKEHQGAYTAQCDENTISLLFHHMLGETTKVRSGYRITRSPPP